MNRKFLAILALAVLLPFGASAKATFLKPHPPETTCQQAESAYTPLATRYQRGLLFRVEKCGQVTSYMVGTIHLDDPATLRIFKRLHAILPEVKRVGFEFVEDDKTSAVAASYMFFPATSRQDLTQLITPQEFETLAKTLQSRAKFPLEATKRMRPWAASIVLQFPVPVADGISLDKRLQIAAREAGKNLYGLETPEEQYEVFANIPEAQQIAMLRDAMMEMSVSDSLNNEFLQAYLAEDLVKLGNLADDSFDMNSNPQLREYLETHLLDKRNSVMVRRLIPHLVSGEPNLAAIGALHLMGESGVLSLLEQQGFRIYVQE